jgi:hypothetical protein
MSLRIRRGTDGQRQGITFDLGEIAYTTDTKKLYVGDGVSPGGNNVLEATAGIGLSWNAGTEQMDVDGTGLTTSNITEGTNLYFTPDRAQDQAAALFTHAGHTAISFIYDDSAGKITATVSLDGVGIANVQADTDPHLGGDLVLNSHSITGTGGIDLTGNITATSISADLGGDLGLNSYDITGTGNINITGDITATSITADLGGDLGLNSYDITGTGNINVDGKITASDLTVAGAITSVLTGPAYLDTIVPIGTDSIPATIVMTSHYRIMESYTALDTIDANEPGIHINVCRGTTETPTAIEDGNILTGIVVNGFDGTIYDTVASITTTIDGSVSSGVMPGNLRLGVGNFVSSPTTVKYYDFDFYGGFTMPVLTAAPTSPKTAATYVADGVSWDPASIAGSLPYPVFYDGSTYNKLY